MKANRFAKHNDMAALDAGDLIPIILLVVIGLALTPIVQDSANESEDSVGATSAAGRLVSLMPLFYVIILISAVVAYVVIKR